MMVLVFLLRHQECHDAKRAGTRRLLSNFRRCLGCVRQFRSGRVSFRNAERLTKAAGATSSAAVESDIELLGLAASLTDDQFVRVAKRWSRVHQPDHGEALHARLRRRRSLRFFEDDDGMTHLHGCFDPVTGARIANRMRQVAKRSYKSDKKAAGASSSFERRSFDQCMADALDVLTTGSGSARSACMPTPGRPAEISVVAHLNDESSGLVAEIVGGDPLPPSVLDELMCNSTLKGLLFGSKGVPLWQGYSKRSATPAQINALTARDQGCIGCGINPALCQAHHVMPWSKGGSTDITNMVLVCWKCHNKIHHHNWQIIRQDGKPELIPPNGPNYGPARAEQPITQTPRHNHGIRPPPNRSQGEDLERLTNQATGSNSPNIRSKRPARKHASADSQEVENLSGGRSIHGPRLDDSPPANRPLELQLGL